MSTVKEIDLGLKGALDELFMDDAGRAENRLPKIQNIPLSEIDEFPDHPFRVLDDEDMDQLLQSVRENGIITPVTLRKKEDGRYEIVSGHRRCRACEMLELETVRAEVKELTREEAIILMVESNLQRTNILPSEKAFAYKMKFEALSHQGKATLDQDGPKWTVKEIGREANESMSQVKRYIRLTYLVPDLLEKVDKSKIALSPAVELSFLTENEQSAVLDSMEEYDCTPSHAQTIRMKKMSQEGTLTKPEISKIMSEEKANQIEKLKIPVETVRRFFPKNYSVSEIEKAILKLCEESFKRHARQEKDAR